MASDGNDFGRSMSIATSGLRAQAGSLDPAAELGLGVRRRTQFLGPRQSRGVGQPLEAPLHERRLARARDPFHPVRKRVLAHHRGIDDRVEEGVGRKNAAALRRMAFRQIAAVRFKKRSMKPVSSLPAMKSGSSMIWRWSGMEVLMPSTTMVSRARRMRAIASSSPPAIRP